MFPTRRIVTSRGDVFRDEYSLEFDGTNDYIDCGDTTSFDGVNDLTISAWIYYTDANVQPAISKGAYNNDTASFWFGFNAVEGRLQFSVNRENGQGDGTGIYFWTGSMATYIPINTWTNIVAVYSNTTDTFVFYVNGLSHAVGTSAGTYIAIPNSAVNLTIGSDPTNFFNGNISDVAIYNTALTSSQVKTIYNGREPYNHKEGVASGSLVSWWRMGDGALDHRQTLGLVADQTNATIGSLITATKNYGSLDFSDTDYWTPASNCSVSDANTIVTSATNTGVYEKSGETTDTIGNCYKVRLAGAITANTLRYRNASDSNIYFQTSDSTFDETFYYIATAASVMFNMNDSATLDITTYEKQLIGANAGVLINFNGSDFKGDTP
tara:strand:+ start:828 stop:1970 length:1143 start_codon:yes stop_codon:yes gene_type:complete